LHRTYRTPSSDISASSWQKHLLPGFVNTPPQSNISLAAKSYLPNQQKGKANQRQFAKAATTAKQQYPVYSC
jgi:hypothetical protein